jgi:SAM-dependent methyltransferase
VTGRAIPLVISLDTEEDNWVPARTGASVENLRELPRLAVFFGRLGVRATYFTTYQVTTHPWAVDIVRAISDAGAGEIAAHLHPWNTPPHDGAEPAHFTMLNNYDAEQQLAKIGFLTRAVEEAWGSRPQTFRAGRFGLGRDTVAALIQHGYRVDSSVTPFVSWESYDSGPSFLEAPVNVYRMNGQRDVVSPVADGPLVEVPLSVGYTRFSLRHWTGVTHLFRARGALAARIPGVAARSGLVRRAILSPETNSVSDMIALSRRLLDGGVTHLQMFFHSSSLRPGLTPFTRSRRDVDRLLGKIEEYVEALSRIAAVQFCTIAEVAGIGLRSPQDPGAQPERPLKIVASDAGETPNRNPRALVINYHYPPDGSVGGLRWAGLSKYLVRLGWEVHVLTAAAAAGPEVRDGVQIHVCERRRTLNDLYRAVAGKVRAARKENGKGGDGGRLLAAAAGRRGLFATVRREVASLLTFPDESRGWMLRTALEARSLMRRFHPDVVVSSGPPHSAHVAGALAVLGQRTPLVVDFRDPWSTREGAWRDDPIYGTGSSRLLIPHLERLVFKVAREVIANTQELVDKTVSQVPTLHVTWLRNGVDIEELPPGDGGEPLPGLAITYAGTLYGGRDLMPVLRAFREFLDRNPQAETSSRLRIAGFVDAARRGRLLGSIATCGLEGVVELLGVVSREQALSLVQRSGVAVVLAQNQDLQIPAKLYETVALRTPTLVIAERESATAREAHRLGAVTAAPDDVADIANLFGRIWRGEVPSALGPPDSIDYARLAIAAADILGRREGRGTQSLPLNSGDPGANWMWLADPAAWRNALEITGGASVLAAAMGLRFDRVESWSAASAREGIPGEFTLPYPDGSFDCVAIHEAWNGQPDAAPCPLVAQSRVFEEIRRVLRPGGCLYVATDNPRWYRRLLSRTPMRSGAWIHHKLRQTGFTRTERYYVTPSLQVPRSIIPVHRGAVNRYERETFVLTVRGVLRRWLGVAGLHQVLHPGLLYVAYR